MLVHRLLIVGSLLQRSATCCQMEDEVYLKYYTSHQRDGEQVYICTTSAYWLCGKTGYAGNIHTEITLDS